MVEKQLYEQIIVKELHQNIAEREKEEGHGISHHHLISQHHLSMILEMAMV